MSVDSGLCEATSAVHNRAHWKGERLSFQKATEYGSNGPSE